MLQHIFIDQEAKWQWVLWTLPGSEMSTHPAFLLMLPALLSRRAGGEVGSPLHLTPLVLKIKLGSRQVEVSILLSHKSLV